MDALRLSCICVMEGNYFRENKELAKDEYTRMHTYRQQM